MISISNYEVSKGKNKGKIHKMITIPRESNPSWPLHISIEKIKQIFAHKEEIEMVLAQMPKEVEGSNGIPA